jgi:hypothetical protein
MKYDCKICNLKFSTEAAEKLHNSVFHKKEIKAPKTPKKRSNRKDKILSNDGRKGYPSDDGKFVSAYLPDGKSKKYKDYVKLMRTDFPDFKQGDKISAKEVRDLFKHDVHTTKGIKGAKLEVKKIITNKNGIKRYRLENSKITLNWAEGLAFSSNADRKMRDRHVILPLSLFHKK